MARVKDLMEIFADASVIFEERHKKYGTKTPRDRKTALDMCQVKLDRLRNFTLPADKDALYDSVVDLINYAAFVQIIEAGQWDLTDESVDLSESISSN